MATGGSDDAVSMAVNRIYLAVNLVQEAGFPTSLARCSATGLLREYSVAELNDPNTDPKRARRIVASCRT